MTISTYHSEVFTGEREYTFNYAGSIVDTPCSWTSILFSAHDFPCLAILVNHARDFAYLNVLTPLDLN